MIKSNSKKAIENIRAYIMDNMDTTNFDFDMPVTFEEAAFLIMEVFHDEVPDEGTFSTMNKQEKFIYWCSGLPTILNTCYYYNRSAVDDLGAILEETESEKNQYTESQAAEFLTKIILRELKKGEKEWKRNISMS